MPVTDSARTICAVFVLALTVSLGVSAASAQQAPPPAVVVAPAALMDLRASTDFTGRIVAIQKVDIRARVSGFLEEIGFKEGDRISKETVLYRIEPGAYQAAVEEIEGSIKAADSERQLAEIERQRKSRLVGSNTVSQSELDVAEAQLGKSEGEIERLKGTLERAKLDLSYTEIKAPFDGIVGLSAVDVGALVGPDSGPLTTLTRLDTVHVEFPVSTAILLAHRERVKKGETSNKQIVQIILPDGSVYPEKGDIDYVDASVSGGTDTVTIRAAFANPDGALPDNALVRVSIEEGTPQEVLAVPQQAVQRDLGGSFVMVVDGDSKVEMRRVNVARTTRGFAVISEGLKEGDQVITEGVNKVRPGITVNAATAGG
jgi:membrane fusion protein (multidrug efflux system)